MKSNREAKRLLGIIGKISNRKAVLFQKRDYTSSSGWRIHMVETVKRSASQSHSRKRWVNLDMKKFMEELDGAFPLPKMGVTTDE